MSPLPPSVNHFPPFLSTSAPTAPSGVVGSPTSGPPIPTTAQDRPVVGRYPDVLSGVVVAVLGTSLSLVAPASVVATTGVGPSTIAESSVVPRSATTAENAAASTPLTRGDRGQRVVELQQALLAAGVTVRGGADGIFGDATQRALSSFQSSQGLRATGSLDITTAHLLELGPAPEFPRRGDRGESVVAVQQAVISSGTNVRGGADGVFGGATERAIATFQTGRGLAPTGRIDVRTAIALGIAPQSPAVTTTTGSTTVGSTTVGSAFPRRGQTNESVTVLQRALIAAGVTVRGGADGVFGLATETALKVYQRGVRRPATGSLDEITAQLLGLAPAPAMPKHGDRGDSVATVQRGLATRGITVRGGADGVFGRATETALTTFQAAQGLPATGRLDLVTYFLLVAPTDPSPTTTDAGANNSGTTNDPGTTTDDGSTNQPTPAAVFPVQGPCWFADTWLAPRSGGRRHQGVDIIAPTGKAVYAVANGMITRKFLDRPGSLGGNALRLTAADGTYFHYAHFSTFADGIDVGSEVVAGQIIGYVGSTGSSSTPHLHFEYHPFGGAAVNPYPIVKKIDACKVVDPLPQPGGAPVD